MHSLPSSSGLEEAGTAGEPSVSMVIPVFNEEPVIDELISRCLQVLDETPGSGHELVLVDDGSSDGTLERVRAWCRRDPRLSCVQLSRNFGHQTALTAGLDHCDGDVVFVLDGDLQDRPEELPRFLAKYAEGYDAVFAKRTNRKESWILRFSYRVAYRVIAALADTPIPLDSGDYSLLSRRLLDAIRRAPERHRYLRGLRAWVGFRQTALPIERDARLAGVSKYDTKRLMRLGLDGIFSFSVVPLRLVSLLGLLATTFGLLYLVYALLARLLTTDVPSGFTALAGLVVLSLGTQLLSLGVIGEYVGRIYTEAKRRPHYVVEAMHRLDDDA